MQEEKGFHRDTIFRGLIIFKVFDLLAFSNPIVPGHRSLSNVIVLLSCCYQIHIAVPPAKTHHSPLFLLPFCILLQTDIQHRRRRCSLPGHLSPLLLQPAWPFLVPCFHSLCHLPTCSLLGWIARIRTQGC